MFWLHVLSGQRTKDGNIGWPTVLKRTHCSEQSVMLLFFRGWFYKYIQAQMDEAINYVKMVVLFLNQTSNFNLGHTLTN